MNLSVSDYEDIKKVISYSETISKIHHEMCELEIKGKKSSTEFTNKVNMLSIVIDTEEKVLKRLFSDAKKSCVIANELMNKNNSNSPALDKTSIIRIFNYIKRIIAMERCSEIINSVKNEPRDSKIKNKIISVFESQKKYSTVLSLELDTRFIQKALSTIKNTPDVNVKQLVFGILYQYMINSVSCSQFMCTCEYDFESMTMFSPSAMLQSNEVNEYERHLREVVSNLVIDKIDSLINTNDQTFESDEEMMVGEQILLESYLELLPIDNLYQIKERVEYFSRAMVVDMKTLINIINNSSETYDDNHNIGKQFTLKTINQIIEAKEAKIKKLSL